MRIKPESHCPQCGKGKPFKAFYAFLPGWFCSDEECSCAWGPCAWVAFNLGMLGPIIVHTGSYWAVLWDYLAGTLPESEGGHFL